MYIDRPKLWVHSKNVVKPRSTNINGAKNGVCIGTRNAPGRSNCQLPQTKKVGSAPSAGAICTGPAAGVYFATMRFGRLIIGVGLVLFLSVAVGCKTPSETPARRPTEHGRTGRSRPLEQVARAHAHYATGVLLRMKDDTEGALEQFAQAALLDPENEALALEVAQQYTQRDQPLKALQVLTNAAAVGPGSAELYTQLGSIYARLGKTDLAEKSYRLALAKAPNSIVATRNLFLVLMRQKRFARAGQVLDSALRQPPKKAEFYVELAELYTVYSQQYPQRTKQARTAALRALDKAVELKPINPHTQLKIADGFALLDEPARALALYKNLFGFYREFPGLRNTVRAKMAEQCLRLGDTTNAVEHLEAIALDQPADPVPYFWLGTVALRDNKPAVAAQYFAKSVLFGPDFEQAYYELARAQLASEQPAAALETLAKARARFGKKFALEYLTGLAYAQQKEYAQAIQHYIAAEQLAQATNPRSTNALLYFQLGAAYERNGQFGEAATCFKKAIAAEPDFAEALNYLGYMWAERGQNLRQARVLIERAVKLDPTNAAYLDSLGWVLFKQNRPRHALKYIMRAAELSEKPDPTIFDHLGDIYIRLGQRDKALDAWHKSLALEHSPDVKAKLDRYIAPDQ